MNVVAFNRPRDAVTFNRLRGSRQAVLGNPLLHPDCPIEQAFRSDDPKVRLQLMQHAWQRTGAADQVCFVADHDGLRVLGHSEAALNNVAQTLRDRFGSRMRVVGPIVRYVFGVPVLEPYMTVLVKGPLAHLPRVRKGVARRRGCIDRVTAQEESFVLEAEAPLAALLGIEAWLQELFGEDWEQAYVDLRLSRYVTIDGDGPEAA
jgi:hypothetical protein